MLRLQQDNWKPSAHRTLNPDGPFQTNNAGLVGHRDYGLDRTACQRGRLSVY